MPNIQASRQTRVNLKNTTVYGLMQKLLECPVIDPGDIAFIKSEFLKWETTFEGMSQSKSSDGRLTFEDKLRVIHIIANDDVVRAEYLRSTDGKKRAGVDYQNTDKAPKDWKELLCERFNDEDLVYETKPLPDLHDMFRNSITLHKGSIELTPDKVKTTMTDYKKKVMETIRKYSLSGNGSDMAIFPDDESGEYSYFICYIFILLLTMFIVLLGEGGALESDKTYGRFNRDLAIKRAQRQGRDDLLIINGDDRKEFLGPFGPEVLYWWDMMDANNLIYFFAGKLGKKNRASCDETPAATTRGSGDEGSSSEHLSKKIKSSRETLQKEMNENVARMLLVYLPR